MKALLTLALASAFANTNAGGKLYVCATPQPDELDQTDYEALTWVEVGGVGNHGETGTSTNILTYNVWGTDFTDKAKGVSDAGSPTVEVAYDPADAGQDVMRTIAKTKYKYAFKIELDDAPDTNTGASGTIRYNRGLVAGPTEPNGGVEDFVLEVYTLAFVQEQIKVEPVAGTP